MWFLPSPSRYYLADFDLDAAWLTTRQIATKGDRKHYLLFDAGPEGEVWDRNSRRLRAEIGLIDHSDLQFIRISLRLEMTGGLTKAIDSIKNSNNCEEPVMMDVHPNRPAFRGVQADRPISLEADPSFEELEVAGATLLKSDQPHTVLDDFFLVSGEIPRQTKYEDGIHGGVCFNPSTGKWEEDTLIMEERYVMCNLKDLGTARPRAVGGRPSPTRLSP
ncbi:uncharacterized protein EURHEDRAFT_527090 [Aspergillus ruber CBS 135680]|uniref:Uncharacterized protein n=1 Tax=Aspergillus ruber (strain CBS 135680) TaxID=1388766 RepID=A0A017S078_ASPRC|nr:uncharacterized protein EURHEDRAFT_527090 [Aspergillus ruber CBS 135680]EYE90362.1 hypothetical protein EURHEDRAFT_527090 [Aspergillus ruber CBS 135680]